MHVVYMLNNNFLIRSCVSLYDFPEVGDTRDIRTSYMYESFFFYFKAKIIN